MNQIVFDQGAVLTVFGILALLAFFAIVGFTIVACRHPDLVRQVKGTRIWDYVVLTLVGCTILILGMQGRLEPQAVAGLLGSMIGYTVGSHRGASATGQDHKEPSDK